ncbi:helix-turn-helix domain-containing protein [uncultured Draconibacterium sp.]|uniref:helix-turn-helix domain-containing protein n=1 Tax=uncultured Draconibacterium sp. TaxID=1573823 RepID=UPI0025F3323F|nr:helix-turn-helix domain-containing protein [uncultured Draconibacterium sp.]
MSQQNQERTGSLIERATRRIQFVDTTPEEATQPIIDEIRNGFKMLLTEFQPRQPEEYVTLDEAAKRLHVDKSTLHNWRKRGVVRGWQIGNRVYLKWSEVEASIQPLK